MGELRITIDPVACDAYGYCAELLPEAISLDEWGYPIVEDRAVPPHLKALAKRAVRDCPKRAITIRNKHTR
jgi:ferredoxin